jgi:hypothetical protein
VDKIDFEVIVRLVTRSCLFGGQLGLNLQQSSYMGDIKNVHYLGTMNFRSCACSYDLHCYYHCSLKMLQASVNDTVFRSVYCERFLFIFIRSIILQIFVLYKSF